MKKVKTLTLHVKRKWFLEMRSGRKKEEYRELKEYWTKRLVGREYDRLVIMCGYPKKGDYANMLFFNYSGYRIIDDMIHPDTGMRGPVYAIKLGEVING